MTTAYDPYGVPGPRRLPQDPLLSLPDHPSGEWATAPRTAPRFGHPRPASEFGDPFLSLPTGDAAYPVVADPATEPAVLNGRGRSRLAMMLFVVLLLVVAGWQAWRLDRVDNRLGTSNAQLTAAMQRQDQLTERADRLEQKLAAVFDPEAISSSVLPSVFRVRAGNFTGTAFSVGAKAKEGEANLLTNYHVVESVWASGGRKVFLER